MEKGATFFRHLQGESAKTKKKELNPEASFSDEEQCSL